MVPKKQTKGTRFREFCALQGNSVRCKGGGGKKIKEMCHKATVLKAERIVMRVEIM